jgi:hypothetical protein
MSDILHSCVRECQLPRIQFVAADRYESWSDTTRPTAIVRLEDCWLELPATTSRDGGSAALPLHSLAATKTAAANKVILMGGIVAVP